MLEFMILLCRVMGVSLALFIDHVCSVLFVGLFRRRCPRRELAAVKNVIFDALVFSRAVHYFIII